MIFRGVRGRYSVGIGSNLIVFENTIDRTGSMYVGGPFNCCLQLSKYRLHVGSDRVGWDG